MIEHITNELIQYDANKTADLIEIRRFLLQKLHVTDSDHIGIFFDSKSEFTALAGEASAAVIVIIFGERSSVFRCVIKGAITVRICHTANDIVFGCRLFFHRFHLRTEDQT